MAEDVVFIFLLFYIYKATFFPLVVQWPVTPVPVTPIPVTPNPVNPVPVDPCPSELDYQVGLLLKTEHNILT